MSRFSLAFHFLVCSLTIISTAKAETLEVRESLLSFMSQLRNGNPTNYSGWNASSDPCLWDGVICNANSSVTMILLEQLSLTGSLNATSLCIAKSLRLLSLTDNNINGHLPIEIANCTNLTHIYLHNNSFTGILPAVLLRLTNLKRLDVSDNRFSGSIPDFNFTNLQEFNVSNNMLSGEIPDGGSRFGASSFSGNPGLCGEPLTDSCTAAPAHAPTPDVATAIASPPSLAFHVRPMPLAYSLFFAYWIFFCMTHQRN